MLKTSLLAGGAALVAPSVLAQAASSQTHSLAKGQMLGTIEFLAEGNVPMDTPVGAELDGRLFTDLSGLALGTRTIPTDRFFVRTRASALREGNKPWNIRCNGLLQREVDFGAGDIQKMSTASGRHFMECSGNIANAHFGMLGVADWSGVRIADILGALPLQPAAKQVMISGFDEYSQPSITSMPGASWVFSIDQLTSAGALLATRMNGTSLTPDHGSPVRLLVPGWYGCTCIKWVNQITAVDNQAPATGQMQEYASRTMQSGTPALARDFQAAEIEPAAMPIRVERWKVGKEIRYRIVGILWGKAHAVRLLQIRFNPDEEFMPVQLYHDSTTPWRFWTYEWKPTRPGIYSMQLRVKEPELTTRRLDQGYYIRSVQISEA